MLCASETCISFAPTEILSDALDRVRIRTSAQVLDFSPLDKVVVLGISLGW